MAERKYQKYILTDLKLPDGVQKMEAEYNKRATRILWLEDEIMEGAFSVICSWYWKATEEEGTPSHTHDFDEIIGFFGSDSQNPRDLGGEVEFWLEDEKFILDKSFLVYIPAGMVHCPLKMWDFKAPMFHYTVGPGQIYE